MSNLQPHKHVPAKVIAYVDDGIKELVELLNTFEKVSTFESFSVPGVNLTGFFSVLYPSLVRTNNHSGSENTLQGYIAHYHLL